MTKDKVRAWLQENYANIEPAELECILNQDGSEYVEDQAERYAGRQFEPGPEAYAEGLEYALSSLYECHSGPHLTSCPSTQ